MFFAPQCAALRCPWLSALLMPVVRVPSCARGLKFLIRYLYRERRHPARNSVTYFCSSGRHR